MASIGASAADQNSIALCGNKFAARQIALGHPLGASGTKLMATLIHALGARDKRCGPQTMCEGGGVANVMIVEALEPRAGGALSYNRDIVLI